MWEYYPQCHMGLHMRGNIWHLISESIVWIFCIYAILSFLLTIVNFAIKSAHSPLAMWMQWILSAFNKNKRKQKYKTVFRQREEYPSLSLFFFFATSPPNSLLTILTTKSKPCALTFRHLGEPYALSPFTYQNCFSLSNGLPSQVKTFLSAVVTQWLNLWI